MRRFHAISSAGLLAAVLAVGGCAGHGARRDGGGGGGADAAGAAVPLGSAALAPGVRGVKLLVVGDSWARNLGVGAADADRDRRNVVVNAGEPGCGLMQPVRIRRQGRMIPAPARCNRWPERWRDLVARYHPTAVLLEVGYWDGQDSQQLPGHKGVQSITAPDFRRRFDAQIDRAIGILSAGGARVYLPTVVDNSDAARANSDAMNAAVHAAVRRNPAHAALLDLHGQLCSTAKVCPREVSGIQVYDDTGHPSAAAHDRLGAWILNSIYTDLSRTPSRGGQVPTKAGH
jgi:lysophospholipase L1-like esterase